MSVSDTQWVCGAAEEFATDRIANRVIVTLSSGRNSIASNAIGTACCRAKAITRQHGGGSTSVRPILLFRSRQKPERPSSNWASGQHSRFLNGYKDYGTPPDYDSIHDEFIVCDNVVKGICCWNTCDVAVVDQIVLVDQATFINLGLGSVVQ